MNSVIYRLRARCSPLARPPGYPELGGADAAWQESAGAAAALPSGAGGEPRPSRWPVLVYLATVLGAPYLIFRLLRAGGGARPDNGKKGGKGQRIPYYVQLNGVIAMSDLKFVDG